MTVLLRKFREFGDVLEHHVPGRAAEPRLLPASIWNSVEF